MLMHILYPVCTVCCKHRLKWREVKGGHREHFNKVNGKYFCERQLIRLLRRCGLSAKEEMITLSEIFSILPVMCHHMPPTNCRVSLRAMTTSARHCPETWNPYINDKQLHLISNCNFSALIFDTLFGLLCISWWRFLLPHLFFCCVHTPSACSV